MQGERTVCCGSKYVIALYIRLSQEDRDISLRADKAESNSITNQKQQYNQPESIVLGFYQKP